MKAKITYIGCAGHYIAAQSCRFRLHTQVGDDYRISTVGEMYYPHRDEMQPIGSGPDDFFETYVFRTSAKPASGSNGCGCHEVTDWCEIEGHRTATARDAAEMHQKMVEKYGNVCPMCKDDGLACPECRSHYRAVGP